MKKRLLKKAAACILTASLAVSALPLSAYAIGTDFAYVVDIIDEENTIFRDGVFGMRNDDLISNYTEKGNYMELSTQEELFKCTWDTPALSGCNVGQKFDNNIPADKYSRFDLDYEIYFEPEEGDSYYGCYINFADPYFSCYVIEGISGTFNASEDAVSLGQYIDSQGNRYDLVLNHTYLGGYKEFYAIKTISESSDTSKIIQEGTVDIAALIKAFNENDYFPKNIYSVSFGVEAANGKGKAEILKNNYTFDTVPDYEPVTIKDNTVTASQTGYAYNNYTYTLDKENDDDAAIMYYEDDGTFNCSWTGKGSELFSMCRTPENGTEGKDYYEIGVDYNVDLEKSTKSTYYGVTGKFDENTDFYIVDGWSLNESSNKGISAYINEISNSPESFRALGTYPVNDVFYSVFTEKNGEKTTIYSIRQNDAYLAFDENGKMYPNGFYTDVTKHIAKWNALGIECGIPESAGAFVKAEGGSGFADVTRNLVIFAEKLDNTKALLTNVQTLWDGDCYYKITKTDFSDTAMLNVGEDGSFGMMWDNAMPVKLSFGKKYNGKSIDEIKDLTVDLLGDFDAYYESEAYFAISGSCNDSKLTFNIINQRNYFYPNFDNSLGIYYDGSNQYDISLSYDKKGNPVLWCKIANGSLSSSKIESRINISKFLDHIRKLGFDIDTLDYAEANVYTEKGVGECRIPVCKFTENNERAEHIDLKKNNYMYIQEDGYALNLFSRMADEPDITYKSNGTYDCKWSVISDSNILVGKETFPQYSLSDYKDITVDYSLIFEPDKDGDAYFGAEAWFNNPKCELMIIEGYSGKPVKSDVKLGVITVDGIAYTVYEKMFNMVENISYPEATPFYVCVRQDNAYNGTNDVINGKINVSAIAEAMKKYGFTGGDLGGVDLNASVIKTKGSVSVLKNDISITPANEIIKGDFNDDGIVDAFDLIIAKELLIQNDYIEHYSDLNNNRYFDIGDVVLLQKYILGKIDTL